MPISPRSSHPSSIRVNSCTANALAAIIQFNHRRFLIFTNPAGDQIVEVQVYLADEN